ncbi:MAG: hypothetical protein ACTHMY_03435 [Solirubrobacteraceae bacterium]
MWEYEVHSEAADVPAMTDLGQPHISTPARRGDCFDISFPSGDLMTLVRYESAVGRLCVVRRSQDGVTQQCGGAVVHVTPNVRITLNGEGWQESA